MSTKNAHKVIDDGKFEVGESTNAQLISDARNFATGKTILEKSAEKFVGKAAEEAESSFEKFDRQYSRLIKKQAEVEKHVKKEVTGLKRKADEVANALGRINKIAGDGFEQKLVLLERFANAVSELDELNSSGRLDKVIDMFNSIRK